jgi:hypothetical protein
VSSEVTPTAPTIRTEKRITNLRLILMMSESKNLSSAIFHSDQRIDCHSPHGIIV